MKLLTYLLPTLLALTLVGAASAQSLGGYIQDDAGLFSATAILEADQKIDTLHDKTHVAFWVRTMKTLPESLVDAMNGKSGKVQAQLFKNYALELAEKEGRRGVYLLICDAPRHQHSIVVVHPPEIERLVSRADVNSLRLLFSTSRLQKVNTADITLGEGVEKVQHILYTRSADTNLSWPLIGAIGSGFLGLWMLLGLLRMRMNKPNQASAESPAQRNHLVGGMLGGMFGGVAGHWIYDTLFNRQGQGAPVSTTGGDSQEEAARDEIADEDRSK